MTLQHADVQLPWRDPPAPGVEVSAAIRKACTRDLRKGYGLSAGGRVALSLAIGASVAGSLMALIRGPTSSAREVSVIGGLAWTFALCCVLASGLGRPPGRRGPRSARLSLAVGLPVLFLAYLGLTASSILPFGRFSSEGIAHVFTCGLVSLSSGAVATGGVLWVWRRTDPLTPGLSGALAGMCGGLASALGMGVACSSHEGWHLWLAHGSIVLLLAVAGALAGRKWLTP